MLGAKDSAGDSRSNSLGLAPALCRAILDVVAADVVVAEVAVDRGIAPLQLTGSRGGGTDGLEQAEQAEKMSEAEGHRYTSDCSASAV